MTTTTPAAVSIRERRRALGVSRLDLGIRASVSSTWLSELEAGRRPRGPALSRILETLDELEAERQDVIA